MAKKPVSAKFEMSIETGRSVSAEESHPVAFIRKPVWNDLLTDAERYFKVHARCLSKSQYPRHYRKRKCLNLLLY
jgi:hypothetical protein